MPNIKLPEIDFSEIEKKTNERVGRLKVESSAFKTLLHGSPEEKRGALEALGDFTKISEMDLVKLMEIRDQLRSQGDNETAEALSHLHSKHLDSG